ncbi:probable Rho GTPase-activating protein CG5521 [Sitophilus oryzae]|uniref:Probable Rho GTPase-activating protein CG5521 n=1 Tax=Sitophilus oryzae TaxID=7048 RepID=A0A6J2XTZ2_SITOR|nr:probable Rho GTPase-activating protein CG5521 [Sitophilus oryzae]
MFSKKNLVDVKKSTTKLQDPKKDVATRIKHLKLILDNVDTSEAKGLFEANFSHIYNILYESFLQMESNLRQRVHKAHKEELDCTLWILEQVICLLPELIHRRWQLHSLGRMIAKLLHSGNSIKLRRQGIKYFLMWYQALNDNAPEYVHKMFASLVPTFNNHIITATSHTSGSIFHDAQLPVSAPEMLPILPPSSGEKPPEHPSRFYLECLLDNMVHTVIKLEWQDKSSHHHQCFSFLLEQFKTYYLPKICPSFNVETSLYRPNLELPLMRKMENETDFVFCRVSLIMWLTSYMHHVRRPTDHQGYQHHPSQHSHSGGNTHQTPQSHDEDNDSSHPSLDSNISMNTNKAATDEELTHQIVRDVLCSNRDNINFIHEIYRQALLLNFSHVVAVRKIIQVYKDLIQGNVTDLPPYALEPPDDTIRGQQEISDNGRMGRLRNDSYLGAIHKENVLVRAGMQNLYQLFMTHAANVFLLEGNPHIPRLLEEQTDACKRVLNIYRFMVMNVRMDSNTWEQLLVVLLQITSLVLGETPPKKKILTLGGKLAPAIFQTLIVTWIKANLNVAISRELWDRFLDVLTSLTNWEELIKEWAKTMETLTRVLARHVYNLDLTNLPLDRLIDQKSKRSRRVVTKSENTIHNTPSLTSNIQAEAHTTVCRQDSSLPDGNIFASKRLRSGLTRSYSETSLNIKRRTVGKYVYSKHRRSRSLEMVVPQDTESTDRTRSPSPAPSSGIESNSIKDSPIQLDVLSENNSLEPSGENRGVVCGGSIRGWLPDVAVILWKRMLGALGDVNQITDSKLHSQVFEYLIKLTDILIKIKHNQGISLDNMSTPQSPELVPPITLILPWCFGALCLPDRYEGGKLNALRLLITIILNCDSNYRVCLSQFYCSIHTALTSSLKSTKNISIKYLGPRFLSLQLPGSSLLFLDVVYACNEILNTSDKQESIPRIEAVSILTNLLSLPDDLSSISVLQPEPNISIVNNCPDIKEHVVSILLKAGRREPIGKARCIALSGLGMFIYKELTNHTFHGKVVEALNVLLMALKFNNKMIAQFAADLLFLLCDYAVLLWNRYPRSANAVISELCSTLLRSTPLDSKATESDRSLCTALLLCLGEWCMKLGPERLLAPSEYGENRGSSLLLQVFTALHKIVTGNLAGSNTVAQNKSTVNEDFDPNVSADDFYNSRSALTGRSSNRGGQSKAQECQKTVTLCAETVLAHLVNHLGHFPMAIGAARLSSLVAENDDVPNISSDDLSSSIFSVPNIQLFILTKNVIASLIELPALDSPGGGATAGLLTADKQVRVLLRDISGKASWDASILYRTPESIPEKEDVLPTPWASGDVYGNIQPESLMSATLIPHNLPQRAMRNRPPNVLPHISNAAPDLDQLDDLLQYLGHTSPECLEFPNIKLNEPASPPIFVEVEQEIIASIVSQRNVEVEEARLMQQSNSMLGKPIINPNSVPSRKNSTQSESSSLKQGSFGNIEQNAFQQCRLLFSQLGLSGWDRRNQVHLLDKNDRLLRELRNLDNQSCRETHKFAIIYVAPGQEDKNSILSNQSGSAAYENFLSTLAWEIELESHTGFLGGLQKQGSTGMTAPYVATSFLEAIFHVATRMHGDSAEAVLSKTRHLGNDEVHIVWSEHNRDYRRDIIPTEFCDILIVIYPLGNNLNRVTVNCKADVPYFGVLFNEAIVESSILAGLVRATVVCASRSKRMTYQFYQQYYEERAKSLETVVTKHKYSSTYEEFIAKVYSPLPSASPFYPSGSSNTSCPDGISCSNNSSMLAAALLDSHSHLHKGQRVDPKFRVSVNDSSRNVWMNQTDSQNVESSISPRPLKKLGSNFKSTKKALKHDHSVESPPESPVQMIRRK